MPNCSILQCDNCSKTVADALKAGVSYHCFPKDTVIRAKWIEATGRQDWTPSKSSKICSQHFDARDLQDAKNGAIRLKDHAIPVYKVMNISKRSSKRNNQDTSIENQPSPSKEKSKTSTVEPMSRKRTKRLGVGTPKRKRKHHADTTENIEVKREPSDEENNQNSNDEPTSTMQIKSEPVELESSPTEDQTYISFHTPLVCRKSEMDTEDHISNSPRSRLRPRGETPGSTQSMTSPRKDSHLVTSPRKDSRHLVTSPQKDSRHLVTSPRKNGSQLVTSPRKDSRQLVTSPRKNGSQLVTSPRKDSRQLVTSPRKDTRHLVTSPQLNRKHLLISLPRCDSRQPITSPQQASQQSITSPQEANQPSMTSSPLASQPSVTSPRKVNRHLVTPPGHTSQKSMTSPQQGSESSMTSPNRTTRQSMTSPRKPSQSSMTSPQQASEQSMTSPQHTNQASISSLQSVTSPRRGIRQSVTSPRKPSQPTTSQRPTKRHLVTSSRRSTRQSITSPSKRQLISSTNTSLNTEKLKKLTGDVNSSPAKVDEAKKIAIADENTRPVKVDKSKGRVNPSQQKITRYTRKQAVADEENISSIEHIDGQKRLKMSDTSREIQPFRSERDVNVSPRRSKRVTHSMAMTTSPLNSTQITIELENPIEIELEPVVSEDKNKNMAKKDQNIHKDKEGNEGLQLQCNSDLPDLSKTKDPKNTIDSSSQPSDNPRPSSESGRSIQRSISRSSRLSGNPSRMSADSSGFDSDFDYEYNSEENAATGGDSRFIPDNKEMDEINREIVNTVENTMDDAFKDILGVSTDFNWSEDVNIFQSSKENFCGPIPGPIKDYDTPYEAFIDIWTPDIIQHIVSETNRYAKQEIQSRKSSGTLSTYLNSWIDTDLNEIYLLFAIFIYMGLDPRLLESEFWTEGYLELAKIRQLMSFTRFRQLNMFLHFEDHDGSMKHQIEKYETSRRLRKIAPIIGHLNDKFATLYNLHSDIVIDESLTLFKGGPWIQAVMTKPTRVGVKSFELCEPNTGYLYKFLIHRGDGDQIHELSEVLGKKSAEAVLDLLSGLENRGHCVIMDNFFNSPILARYLKSSGFDCYGSLRPNRKYVPNDIKNVQNLTKGSVIARYSGDISCIAWKDDTKMMTMISTCHNTEMRVGRKSGRDAVRPSVVHDYKHIMSAIDFKDGKLSTFLVERKRFLKWYTKIFRRLLNASVLNAHILFQASCRLRKISVITQRQFREKLANALVMKHWGFSPNIPTSEKELRLNRDLVHAPRKHDKYDLKSCVVCLREGINKKVYLSCVVCRVYLCFEDCWADWHYREKLPGEDYDRWLKILNSA